MLHHDRIARVQARMREQGIDAYLILTHDDYIYLFGEDRYQPRAIIPAVGEPIIITFRGEEDEVRSAFGLKDVKVFGTVGQQIKDVVDSMRGLFQQGGHDGKMTVGVQMGFFTPAFLLNMFQKANPQVQVVSIAPVMDELRMVKSADEVAIMRRAADIADAGMRRATEVLRPGLTENEVGAEIEYAMRKAGGHGVATPVFVNSGIRSRWLHGTVTDKRIEAGDLVVIDLVPRYLGYCANLCRTFVVGKPTEDQRKIHAAYLKAQQTVRDNLKPGMKVKQLDDLAKAVFTESGYGDYFVFGISHSIGLMFEETPAPTIHPADGNVEIRTGMTLTIGHSILAVPEVGGVRLEDTYYLAEGGLQQLTHASVELELPIAVC